MPTVAGDRPTVNVVFMGMVDYATALALQEEIYRQVRNNQLPDTLLLLEHPPVITIGRSGGAENIIADPELLRREDIQVHQAGRGGNVTYHGPGQLVGYPILDLRRHGSDVRLYSHMLEETIIHTLAELYIYGRNIPGYPGVWVGEKKIASIGASFRHWVTAHGFALNVQPDLRHFAFIIPCGLAGIEMTSVDLELPAHLKRPSVEEVGKLYVKSFASVFDVECRETSPALPDSAHPPLL